MTKNIDVLDKNGNLTGQTYPKRAKGLVKSGRAEFVNDGAIRLTAPLLHSERTENMAKEVNETTEFAEKINEAVKKAAAEMPDTVPDAARTMSAVEISHQVDKLMEGQAAQMAKLMDVLEKAEFDYKVDAVKVMSDAVRETTNEALKVYRAAALGLGDLSAALKADPGCGPFLVAITGNYVQIINPYDAQIIDGN